MVPGAKVKSMIVLHQFTWQQFLVAALVLTVGWYVAIATLYFRKELSGLFDGKSKPEKLKKEWEEELDDEENLMGRAMPVEGLSTVTMNDFGFVPKERTDERTTRLGVVPDILEELKSIFYILERDKGSKDDFISLFGRISAKYPQIEGSPNQDALNDYIRENLPFEISDEELESLWI